MGGIIVAALAVFYMLPLGTVSGLADAVVQGFQAEGTLKPGRIVVLSGQNSSTVKAAPAGDATKVYGVVVEQSTAPVVVSSQKSDVYVATGGTYPVLVSDENGPIVGGDYIALSSSADGIGAKAIAGQLNIVGKALSNFDGQHGVISSAGNIHIGKVSAQISPGTNPTSAKQSSSAPAALQKIAGSLSGGKNVSAVRIYAGLLVFALTFLAAVSLVWSGVKNGMISIGRNPLSRGSILGSLTQVLILSLIIFGIGMLAVYLILRL